MCSLQDVSARCDLRWSCWPARGSLKETRRSVMRRHRHSLPPVGGSPVKRERIAQRSPALCSREAPLADPTYHRARGPGAPPGCGLHGPAGVTDVASWPGAAHGAPLIRGRGASPSRVRISYSRPRCPFGVHPSDTPASQNNVLKSRTLHARAPVIWVLARAAEALIFCSVSLLAALSAFRWAFPLSLAKASALSFMCGSLPGSLVRAQLVNTQPCSWT